MSSAIEDLRYRDGFVTGVREAYRSSRNKGYEWTAYRDHSLLGPYDEWRHIGLARLDGVREEPVPPTSTLRSYPQWKGGKHRRNRNRERREHRVHGVFQRAPIEERIEMREATKGK